MKKLLLTLLTTLMMITVATVNVVAETPTVKQYDGYMAFGDSMSRGYTGSNYDTTNDFSIRNIPESYPYQVSQAIGCGSEYLFEDKEGVKYWPVCFMGETVTSALDLMNVDHGGVDNIFDHYIMADSYETADQLFGKSEGSSRYQGSQGSIESIVSSFKNEGDLLITICLGQADVTMRPAVNVLVDVYEDYQNGDLNADSNDLIASLLKEAGKQMAEEYKAWQDNYQKLIVTLQSYNPNADILLVGFFNTLKEVTINDQLTLPIGDIANSFIDSMNANLRSYAKEYGCTYVDVSNAESSATAYEWTLETSLGNFTSATHPTAASMAYMARQVINALPLKDEEEEIEDNYDIVVDLIRYAPVANEELDIKEIVDLDVVVNGKKIKDSNLYIDDTVLTVKYDNQHAKTMLITIKTKEETESEIKTIISTRTYALTYVDGHYVPYIIDSTNDVVTTTKKFLTNVKSFFTTVSNTAKSFTKGIIDSIFAKKNTKTFETPAQAQYKINQFFGKSKAKTDETEEPVESLENEKAPVNAEEDVLENKEETSEKMLTPQETWKEQHETNKENWQEFRENWQEQAKENWEKTQEYIENNKENWQEKAKENWQKTQEFWQNGGWGNFGKPGAGIEPVEEEKSTETSQKTTE